MPPEVAREERAQALEFMRSFTALFERIDASPPPARSELKAYVADVTEEIKPFVEYKTRLGEAQTSGNLRSLVWPLFFDHTRNEAERWERRLNVLAAGESEFDRAEVVRFWTNIMDAHSRFVAHLLGPDEFELIEKSFETATVFRDFGSPGGAVAAMVDEPGTVIDSLAKNPELDAVVSAAQDILDVKTRMVRDIEAGRTKSIIEPRLADHVRREALKFPQRVEARRVSGTQNIAELSARCHDKQANFLALNFMHDIVTGARHANGARGLLRQGFIDYQRKKPTPYMGGLRFPSDQSGARRT